MEQRKVYFKSDGFTPKSFIDITDEEIFDVLHDNKLTEVEGSLESIEQKWREIFFEINENFNNDDFGYTTCNLTENEATQEIWKTMECVGNTIVFTLLNINEKNWLHRITEYMVYTERSIATIPGTIIYWLILQCFFEEDGVSRKKGEILLRFILNRNVIIHYHKYIDELYTFEETFPFKPLGIEKYLISDVVSLLELYPKGKLNRYVSAHFTKASKTLSREKVIELLGNHVKTALNGFDIEKLWDTGDTNAIKEFLTKCAMQENKITRHEILKSAKAGYTTTIKEWLGSQVKLINKLIEIEQLKLNRSENTSELGEEPQKPVHDAKYYALYIRILEKVGKETPFVRNEYDRFPKAEIETFAHNRFPGISKQQYYNHYRDLEDMSNKVKIARSYPDLKEIVADIAQNDADVLFELKDFPG